MLSAGYLFLFSGTSFLLGVILFSFERKKGKRFFLNSVRDRIDEAIIFVDRVIRAKYALILKSSLKLSWYYSIHAMLRTLMGILVHSYDTLERVVIKNRARAKRIRAESRLLLKGGSNHLAEIEKHKQSTALTTNQKKKLRAQKLERD